MTPHRTKDTGQGPCRKELDRLDTRQPVGVGAAWRLQQGFSEPADKGAIRPVRRRHQKIDWRGIDGGLVGPFIAGDPQANFADRTARQGERSEEHTSELQSLMRNSYAVFCLKKQKLQNNPTAQN